MFPLAEGIWNQMLLRPDFKSRGTARSRDISPTIPNHVVWSTRVNCFSILKPRHNGRHFVDDILKCILLNENVLIWIKILLKYVLDTPIAN